MTKLMFVMLAGLPASGKSHFRKQYEDDGWTIISFDDLVEKFAEEHNITYNQAFLEMDHKNTHKILDNKLINAIDKGHNICWDQTNLSLKQRKTRTDKIPDTYFKKLVFFDPPEKQLWNDRLNSRPGKIIPDHVMEAMIARVDRPASNECFDSVVIMENYE